MVHGNPNLEERLKTHLREVVKHTGDEEAMNLLRCLEYPTIICEGGWHAEYLLRRFTPSHVEYLDADCIWVRLEAGDSVTSLILGGWMKRFYGPVQTAKYKTDQNVEYIVYRHDIRS